MVEVRRIREEADWAFSSILVEEDFERLAVDKRVIREVDFARCDLSC